MCVCVCVCGPLPFGKASRGRDGKQAGSQTLEMRPGKEKLTKKKKGHLQLRRKRTSWSRPRRRLRTWGIQSRAWSRIGELEGKAVVVGLLGWVDGCVGQTRDVRPGTTCSVWVSWQKKKKSTAAALRVRSCRVQSRPFRDRRGWNEKVRLGFYPLTHSRMSAGRLGWAGKRGLYIFVTVHIFSRQVTMCRGAE